MDMEENDKQGKKTNLLLQFHLNSALKKIRIISKLGRIYIQINQITEIHIRQEFQAARPVNYNSKEITFLFGCKHPLDVYKHVCTKYVRADSLDLGIISLLICSVCQGQNFEIIQQSQSLNVYSILVKDIITGLSLFWRRDEGSGQFGQGLVNKKWLTIRCLEPSCLGEHSPLQSHCLVCCLECSMCFINYLLNWMSSILEVFLILAKTRRNQQDDLSTFLTSLAL